MRLLKLSYFQSCFLNVQSSMKKTCVFKFPSKLVFKIYLLSNINLIEKISTSISHKTNYETYIYIFLILSTTHSAQNKDIFFKNIFLLTGIPHYLKTDNRCFAYFWNIVRTFRIHAPAIYFTQTTNSNFLKWWMIMSSDETSKSFIPKNLVFPRFSLV